MIMLVACGIVPLIVLIVFAMLLSTREKPLPSDTGAIIKAGPFALVAVAAFIQVLELNGMFSPLPGGFRMLLILAVTIGSSVWAAKIMSRPVTAVLAVSAVFAAIITLGFFAWYVREDVDNWITDTSTTTAAMFFVVWIIMILPGMVVGVIVAKLRSKKESGASVTARGGKSNPLTAEAPHSAPGTNPYAQGPGGQNPYTQGPGGQNPYANKTHGENPWS